MKNWGILATLLLPLLSCTHLHHAQQTKAPKPSQIGIHQLPAFNRIKINGAMNVHLHTDAIRSTLLVHGNPNNTTELKWSIKNHTLFMSLPKQQAQHIPVDIDISTRDLLAFTYKGNGSIQGHHLRSKQLDLSIINDGPTTLEGQLNLHHVMLAGAGKVYLQGGHSRDMSLIMINKVHAQIIGTSGLRSVRMNGNSWLSTYWVRTPSLHIRLNGQARAQIAGTTTVLYAHLFDKSRFNGRYLRANEAFVKTHDKSTADIFVLTKQHCLANDQSNIYYHKQAVFETDFMGCNGTVLDLEAWEQY